MQLTLPVDRVANGKKEKEAVKTKKSSAVKSAKKAGLFEHLRSVRSALAKEKGVPAYLVFSDASLREMEKYVPRTESDFLEISGVGTHKMEVYGEIFIAEIIQYLDQNSSSKKDTFLVTFKLYQQGLTVEEISEHRNLKPPTVYSHLAKLYLDGKDVDIKQFVTDQEIAMVKEAKEKLGDPAVLKKYFEYFKEEISYAKIRISLTLLA